MIASLQMENSSLVDCKEMMLLIPYTNETVPATRCVLPVIAAEGQLTIMALALHYKTREQTEKPDWMPAGIVGSFYN